MSIEPRSAATAFLEVATPVVDLATVRAYAAWLSSGAGDPGFDPYYGEAILRFSLRDDDVLQGPGDIAAAPAPCGVSLSSARAGAKLTVCGIAAKDALSCAGAVDGAHTVQEARARAGVAPEAWDVFLRGTFGALTFAPLALARLEGRVSHAEIVRFPGSPYEIVREYWENMADVRERIDAGGVLDAALAELPLFVRFLRELNAVTLLGGDGRSFYRPASPVVGKEGAALVPGALWTTPSVTEETNDGVRFVSGPRVSASLIGGARYQALLARSLGDEESLLSARELAEEGMSWGRVVTARADADPASAPWFCPPRPFGEGHFDAVRRALSAAREAAGSGRPAAVIRQAARVHWRLIRLHPFMSGNQSVAMGLVNGVLRAELGAGIPHLVLDHLALRLSLPAYEQAFARAVTAWLLPEANPVHRTLELALRRQRVFRFLEALRDANDDDSVLRAHPDEAKLALLD
jgi:hypothetical protein